MGTFILRYCLLTSLALVSVMSNFCQCFSTKTLKFVVKPETTSEWSDAMASWYGNPYGAGSDGGACGYQTAVEVTPFSSLVSAIASSRYNSGMDCGTCYEVKCTGPTACSGDSVTMVVTDECPGCDSQTILFDLSGTSFGNMANSGEADQLRNTGIEQVLYRRVDCNFTGVSIAFRVDPGSNGNYFATAIEYENGDGVAAVELKQAANTNPAPWLDMQHLWGAVWKIDLPANYLPPFSIRLTSGGNPPRMLAAEKVIPVNYSPGQTYRSFVNF